MLRARKRRVDEDKVRHKMDAAMLWWFCNAWFSNGGRPYALSLRVRFCLSFRLGFLPISVFLSPYPSIHLVSVANEAFGLLGEAKSWIQAWLRLERLENLVPSY